MIYPVFSSEGCCHAFKNREPVADIDMDTRRSSKFPRMNSSRSSNACWLLIVYQSLSSSPYKSTFIYIRNNMANVAWYSSLRSISAKNGISHYLHCLKHILKLKMYICYIFLYVQFQYYSLECNRCSLSEISNTSCSNVSCTPCVFLM